MLFGTISYLPEEPQRNIRKQVALHCISNLSQVAAIVEQPLHIVTTNWTDKDYQDFNNVCPIQPIYYVIPTEERSCGASRNVLLDILYKSDEDYMLISDDDNIIHINENLHQFIKHIHYKPQDFYTNDLYMILSRNITLFTKTPFNKQENTWNFVYSAPMQLGSPTIHPNTKKHFDKEIFIPISDDLLLREDFIRYIEVAKCSAVPMCCSSFISQIISQHNGSTIWDSSFINFVNNTKKQMLLYYPLAAMDAMGHIDITAYLPEKFAITKTIPKNI